jgi:sulfur carrier protein
MITVIREPEGRETTFEQVHTVHRLLNKLGERPGSVLVIRGAELLTQDRRIEDGDRIIVRKVRSSG